MPHSPNLPFHLGCPVWACDKWGGKVYPESTIRAKWLMHYSRMFNTVEGNSTFYGMPGVETVKRWAKETADGFRFSLKVPRSISHDAGLVNCRHDLEQFLELLEVLNSSDRLGPSFLQLPPAFGPEHFGVLKRFLKHLPEDMPWAVEVRHLDWYDQATNEKRLNELLSDCGMDKVLFDSRPLFQAEPDDVIEAASQQRKPRTPVRQTVTSTHPFLRLVGRNRLAKVERYIDQWLPIVSGWLRDGLQPYLFMHSPDDAFAPDFARRFWRKLCEAPESQDRYELEALPTEPTDSDQPWLFD